MAYLGSWKIDDYLPIPVTTHKFSTGAAFAPTSLTYSIYEDATATGLDEDVDMVVASPFDSVVGFYLARRQLTAAAGFEKGKNYTVLVKATVDGVAAIAAHTFQIEAEVDANVVSGTVGTVTNLTNLPAVTTDWLTAAGVKADAVTKIQSGLALEATLTAIKGAGWSTETLAAIDVLIDAIKAKTDTIPASPAAVGSAMTLADDAITSAKFDENTAFPLKFADAGLTAVARTGADSDTLETLSDEIANLDSAVADVFDDVGDVKTELDLVYADTNELQTDWVNGGRLDLLVDGIKDKTDNLPSDPADQSAVEGAITSAVTSIKGIDGDTLKVLSDQIDGVSPAAIADGIWDELLASHLVPGSTGEGLNSLVACGCGTGSIDWDYYAYEPDGVTPIAGVYVRVYTEDPPVNLVATGITNTFGKKTFHLDPGIYKFYNSKVGYTFPNPDTEVVS